MFVAVWIDGLGLFLAVALMPPLFRLAFGARPILDQSLTSAIFSIAGLSVSFWALRLLPWTSRLVKDLAEARRRPPKVDQIRKGMAS